MHAAETKDHLRELVAVLRAEVEVYRSLIAAVVRTRDTLRRPRSGADPVRTEQHEGLLQRLRALEQRRMTAAAALAPACGCRAEEVSLTRLAAWAPAVQRSELLHCRGLLLEATETLRGEHRRTALLLEHAGELLRSSYSVLKGVTARCGPVYRPGGRLQGARLQGKLLTSDI
jgi:hypothetical protein